jgi:hypothetical protein
MRDGQGWQLAMHLISMHADPMAVARSREENDEQHAYEHIGPGTIRNHPVSLRTYDPAKIEVVLEECEDDGVRAV